MPLSHFWNARGRLHSGDLSKSQTRCRFCAYAERFTNNGAAPAIGPFQKLFFWNVRGSERMWNLRLGSVSIFLVALAVLPANEAQARRRFSVCGNQGAINNGFLNNNGF